MPPARSAQQQQSVLPFVLIGGVLLGVAATVFGFPGLAVVWAAVIVAAFMEPQPVLSGKRPGGGVQPEGPAEEANLARFNLMKELKWRLIVPNAYWFPGWKPQASWVAGVAAAAVALGVPVTEPVWAFANAAAAALLVWTYAGAKRATGSPYDPCPGVRLDKTLIANPVLVGVAGGVGVVVAGVVFFAWSRFVPEFFMSPQLGDMDPRVVLVLAGADPLGVTGSLALVAVGLGVLVAGAVLWSGWSALALYEWRSVVEARAKWDQIWPSVGAVTKKAGPPRLVSHEEIGHLIVDTFESAPDVGAEASVRAAGAIATAYGAGSQVAVLRAPNVDEQGQPVFATPHPTRFVVITTGISEQVDVTDPNIDPKVLQWVLTFGINVAVMNWGLSTVLVTDVQPMHDTSGQTQDAAERRKMLDKEEWNKKVEAAKASAKAKGGGFLASLKSGAPLAETMPEAPAESEEGDAPAPVQRDGQPGALWAVSLAHGANSAAQIQVTAEQIPGTLGCEVVVDPSAPRPGDQSPRGAFRGGRILLIGDMRSVPDGFKPFFDAIMLETEWKPRWAASMKMGQLPPTPQIAVTVNTTYGGNPIVYTPHLMPTGSTLDSFRVLDKALTTSIMPPPEFLTMTGYPGATGRPGDRHPQAFAVVYSQAPVPMTPQALRPDPSSRVNLTAKTGERCPEHWILAGMVNRGFAAARLPYPEVAKVSHLTRLNSMLHLWKINVRLHDGVTLTQVRSALSKVASVMSAPWVQVAPDESDPQSIIIVAGEHYNRVKLENPNRDLLFLTNLEWQSAFGSAKVVNQSGFLPTVTNIAHLPDNPKVSVLDVELPPGISKEQIVAAIPTLRTATTNEFIEVRPGANASSLQMLVAESDPMPLPAPFDFEAVDSAGRTEAPFATGVEGSYLSYDWSQETAGLVSGAAGSGKSVTLEGILYGTIVKGCEVYVGDAQKQAADFHFARPFVKGFATTVEEVSVMLKACVAEYERRQSLMGQYGLSKYTELPDHLRPPHAIVFLDEFNGLIGAEKPRKPQVETPESMAVYMEAMNDFIARQDILSAVTQLVTKARAAGFSVLLGAQRLTADMMKALPNATAMKASLGMRLLVGKATFGDKQVALKDAVNAPELGDSVPKGRAIFERSEAAAVAVQSWFVHPMQDTLGAELAKRIAPHPTPLDLTALVEASRAEQAQQEVAIEGSVIQSGETWVIDPEVVDVGEVDLGDLDLDLGIDASDLDLDDLDLEDDTLTDTVAQWDIGQHESSDDEDDELAPDEDDEFIHVPFGAEPVDDDLDLDEVTFEPPAPPAVTWPEPSNAWLQPDPPAHPPQWGPPPAQTWEPPQPPASKSAVEDDDNLEDFDF